MNRTDFQILAATRRKEAKRLLDADYWDGAYYLSGYVVELALKARIAKTFMRHTWPDRDFILSIHTHDLTKLVKAAGLGPDLDQEIATNRGVAVNWEIVKDWNEHSRYKRWSELQARDLYRAVVNPKTGVLPWIKRHW